MEEVPPVSDYSVDEDHPMRLVLRLQGTAAGCQWLLDQWSSLRLAGTRRTLALVRQAQGRPSAGPTSNRCPRQFRGTPGVSRQPSTSRSGMRPVSGDHERAYGRGSQRFCGLRSTGDETLAPKDSAAARQWLIELVDRNTERLREGRTRMHKLAELDALSAADRLSWDDTAEGDACGVMS